MDEAEAIEALDANGATTESIAGRLGMSPAYIAQRRRLLVLSPAARKAFRKGEITLDDALVLGRIQSSKLQADALKRSRQYRKMRDQDHAWERRDDAAILLEVLPSLDDATFDRAECTTCPKRSGNQSTLFADAIEDKEICTDLACFKRKGAAAYAEAKKRAKDRGVEILTRKQSEKIFPSHTSTPVHSYVMLEKKLADVGYPIQTSSKKTIGEWLDAAGLDLGAKLAKRHDGAPSLVVPRAKLIAAWNQSKAKPQTEAEKKAAARDRSLDRSRKREREKRKLEEAIEKSVADALLDAIAGHTWKADGATTLLRLVLAAFVISDGDELVADREDMTAALEQLKKKNKYERAGVVVANAAPDMKRGEVLYWLARSLVLRTHSDYRLTPESLRPLLELLDVDANAIEAEMRAAAKAKTTKRKRAKPTKRKPAKKRTRKTRAK